MTSKEDKQQIVTIDGPAGVGKSTVSQLVAKATGFTLLDTGAMYRGVGFYLIEQGVVLENNAEVATCLAGINLELYPADDVNNSTGIVVNGRDVTREIRSAEMSMIASKVSAIVVVRDFLTTLQRRYGEKGRIVAEGRDMGSIVFPDAVWKFYLDAQPEIRARRRCEQLREKGDVAKYEETLTMILQRDRNDSEREIAPLCKADDAILIDTSFLSIQHVAEKILSKVNFK